MFLLTEQNYNLLDQNFAFYEHVNSILPKSNRLFLLTPSYIGRTFFTISSFLTIPDLLAATLLHKRVKEFALQTFTIGEEGDENSIVVDLISIYFKCIT